jgi:hypothetical protein
MKKQSLSIIVVIVVLAAFPLNAGFAYATTDAATDQYVQQQASTFLEQVIGMNPNDYKIENLQVTVSALNPKVSETTAAVGTINYKGTNHTFSMDIVHGRIKYLNMGFYPNYMEDARLSPSDALSIAKNAIEAYQTTFNASYLSGFADMIPTTVQAQIKNATIENSDKKINIYYYESTSQPTYAFVEFVKNLGGISLAPVETSIKIARNGLVTMFFDGLAFYRLGTSQEPIAEKQAIDIALPSIEAYANENNRQVVSINATLRYALDASALRSDGYSIFPEWYILALYDGQKTNPVFGYSVVMWGDTGEIYDQNLASSMTTTVETPPPYDFLVFCIAIVQS